MRWRSFLQANSIEGCKRKDVNVVYTRWQNLEKKASYEAGQVGGETSAFRFWRCCFGHELVSQKVVQLVELLWYGSAEFSWIKCQDVMLGASWVSWRFVESRLLPLDP